MINFEDLKAQAKEFAARDVAKGIPPRPESYFARPGSAWEAWYLEGYNHAKRLIEEGKTPPFN